MGVSKARETQDVLFQPTKVDLVTVSGDGSMVLMYVVVDFPWTGSDAQLTSLQEKIHNYVSFALDGQMVRTYPVTAALPWQVVLDCQTGPPDARTQQVLDRLVEPVRRWGGRLVCLQTRSS